VDSGGGRLCDEAGLHPQPEAPMSDAPAAATPEDGLALLLDEQRRCWQRGQRVPVELFLLKLPAGPTHTEALLDLIYQEYLLREERGESPQVTEYQQRFPHLAEQLRIQFEEDRELAPGPRSHRPNSATTSAPTVPSPPVTRPALPTIPGYEVLEEAGRGAWGVVYRARQLVLNRVVALKILRSGA
jgi:hypothetical protein